MTFRAFTQSDVHKQNKIEENCNHDSENKAMELNEQNIKIKQYKGSACNYILRVVKVVGKKNTFAKVTYQ